MKQRAPSVWTHNGALTSATHFNHEGFRGQGGQRGARPPDQTLHNIALLLSWTCEGRIIGSHFFLSLYYLRNPNLLSFTLQFFNAYSKAESTGQAFKGTTTTHTDATQASKNKGVLTLNCLSCNFAVTLGVFCIHAQVLISMFYWMIYCL